MYEKIADIKRTPKHLTFGSSPPQPKRLKYFSLSLVEFCYPSDSVSDTDFKMLGKKISTSSKGRSSLPSTSAQALSRLTVNKSSASPSSPPDSPIVIPYIKAADNFKLLPRYSAGSYRQRKKQMYFFFIISNIYILIFK